MKFLVFLLACSLSYALNAQTFLNADGPGSTYELITSVLAPGYNPIETPDCSHTAFGNHIDEVWDASLNDYAFRFFMHLNEDDDRCINFDRQRNEIKSYSQSPDNLLGIENELVEYKWKFKLDSGFQASPNFTHIHQLKAVDGPESSMPLITLTLRAGTPDKLELRYADTSTQVTLSSTDLSPFKDEWLEVTEEVLYGENGTYSVNIVRLSDQSNLFSYENNSIRMWRTGASFIRPKWGIYRSLNQPSYLRDETVLFANFSIIENPPTSLSGNLFTYVSNLISNMPGQFEDNYTDPSAAELSNWDTLLNNLFASNYITASQQATGLGYELVEFTDTTETSPTTYYILQTASSSSNYWGIYVYNPLYCRELVIQAPHSRKDLKTGLEGTYIFEKAKAAFLAINGTNRCNSSIYSTCSGTTSICGSSEDYRISDLAHNDQSIYQQTTGNLLNSIPNSQFLQLHGFTKGSSDPYVIMSNGTRETPPTDYIVSLANNLYAEDSVLTFKIAHLDLDWYRLIGFTNTQGRLINAGSNPCNSNATNTSGRFIHIEQEKTRLRDDIIGWDKVANACINTYPSICTDCLITNPDSTQTLSGIRVDVNLAVWLEGSYQVGLNNMRNDLYSRELLPGMLFSDSLTIGEETLAGQPYGTAPWFYGTEPQDFDGSEGVNFSNSDYPADVVDWVLVSFRSNSLANSTFLRVAGLLHTNGTISFVQPCILSEVDIYDDIWILVEHRNHIGVMSHQPASIDGRNLSYDFRNQNSWRDMPFLVGFGQKELAADIWVMYAGDGSQLNDLISYDVNGQDKGLWIIENGDFNAYRLSDYNMDGDVNGTEKALWEANNGISSRVPK